MSPTRRVTCSGESRGAWAPSTVKVMSATALPTPFELPPEAVDPWAPAKGYARPILACWLVVCATNVRGYYGVIAAMVDAGAFFIMGLCVAVVAIVLHERRAAPAAALTGAAALVAIAHLARALIYPPIFGAASRAYVIVALVGALLAWPSSHARTRSPCYERADRQSLSLSARGLAVMVLFGSRVEKADWITFTVWLLGALYFAGRFARVARSVIVRRRWLARAREGSIARVRVRSLEPGEDVASVPVLADRAPSHLVELVAQDCYREPTRKLLAL